MTRGLRIAALALASGAALLALTPSLILPVIAPDQPPSPAVARLLPEAKARLTTELDLVAAHVRFVGVETRAADDLVILRFELRPFPYLTAEGAYLVSRCTPIGQLDPHGMGGGRGVRDFNTDPELEHARSEAQPPCDAA